MPFIIARDRGYFREEGLEPELIFMKAAQTIPAMLAGGIDFGTATGTAIVAALSGIDVRVVFAMSDKPSFDLLAAPSITNLQQMRGKKLGITAFGALAETLAREIFLANKVPQEQVTFLPLGTSDVMYVALKAGTIDATMLQIPQNFLAVDEGFRKLASGADFYRAVQGGLTTTKATINERPELVTKMIRATQTIAPANSQSKEDMPSSSSKALTSILARIATVLPSVFTRPRSNIICKREPSMKRSSAR